MRKVAILICAAVLAAPTALAAQRLESGTWGGTVTPPGSVAVPVTYTVRQVADSVAITVNADGIGSFELRNLKIAADKITFDWSPGDVLVSCQLTRREDGSWGGPCPDSNGGTGAMLLVPPRKPGMPAVR